MPQTIFVAEFTTNHLGNFNLLMRMLETARGAGCDIIKMQKKDVETYYSAAKLDGKYDSPYGKTYRDYRTTFEFSPDDFDRFDQECKDARVPWFCTVQDIPSLHVMLSFDLPMIKISSSNANNSELLREVRRLVPETRKIVLSVAGLTLSQIDHALKNFPDHPVSVLHCVAEYPCPPSSLRLGNIPVLIQEFSSDRVEVGYSGHEIGILPSLAAIDLGATMVERHFCVSRQSFAHHIECSLEPNEFAALANIARSGSPLRKFYCDTLPDAAFKTSFGMTEAEQGFLLNQEYGASPGPA
jgi:N-acetylneuraminate synthase